MESVVPPTPAPGDAGEFRRPGAEAPSGANDDEHHDRGGAGAGADAGVDDGAGPTPCPACRRTIGGGVLSEAADLDGRACPRCAGVFLPPAGSDRLLGELLGLDRGALVDLADGFGGHRHRCPACNARMRSLMIRGAHLDLCFHCAGLWLPFQALERVSDGRFTSTTTPAPVLAPTRPPAHHVRLDRRHPVAVGLGGGVLGVGAAVTVGGLLGVTSLGLPTIVAGALCVAIGARLRRRKTLDVFPRARRVLAGRRYLPAVAADDDATTLDEETFLVLRRAGPILWLLHYEDSCGRVLAPIAMGLRPTLLREAQRLAPRLGATLCTDRRPRAVNGRDHDDDDGEDRAARVLTGIAGDQPTILRIEPGPAHTLALSFRQSGRTVLVLKNAVPAQGDERGHDRLRLHYLLEAVGEVKGRRDGPPVGVRVPATRARFHHNDGEVVIVDDDGHVIALVTGAIAARMGIVTITRPRGGPRLHAVGGPVGPVQIVDDGGRRVATLRALDGAIVIHAEPRLRHHHNGATEASLLWLLASVVTLGSP